MGLLCANVRTNHFSEKEKEAILLETDSAIFSSLKDLVKLLYLAHCSR
jgi:hypothetical protein